MKPYDPNQPLWIWYPGDFEIRHALLQNLDREERQCDWPAFWPLDDCRKNVIFSKQFELTQEETFTVYAEGAGCVAVNGQKLPIGKELTCKAGQNHIEIFVANPNGVPSMFIEGQTIKSDPGWTVSDYYESAAAGWDPLCLGKDQSPNAIQYAKEKRTPVSVTETQGGVLFEFEKPLFGSLTLDFRNPAIDTISLYYGESYEEAIDTESCYLNQDEVTKDSVIRKRAFRFVFIPGCVKDDIQLTAYHEYIPKDIIAKFTCDDNQLNRIWKASEETLTLCTDLFFIDGIKRDRWIWSGDAYQSYFVNQYLYFDEAVNRRTIYGLRGQDPIKRQINTILDYSMYWVISIDNHYTMTKDKDFVAAVYAKMVSILDFLSRQIDEKGFITGRPSDWVFIDWADIDKTGAVCAEQMLLQRTYQAMINCGRILGHDISMYQQKFDQLSKVIEEYYWDETQGAFIDSFESGKKNVTRHANIFAILFDFVSDDKKQRILSDVILNENIPEITTPYFKFFELDALCKLGRLDTVFDTIKSYWGAMLDQGAVTIWEQFDPKETGPQRLAMYGNTYGKSLCHAWGASPIYLLGRYFFGLSPTKPGYEEFLIEPSLAYFKELQCTLPIKDGVVQYELKNGKLKITASRDGGTVVFKNKSYILPANDELVLEL